MTLPAGEVGLAYSGVNFAATGGVQPYMFQVIGGDLPDGLSMSRDGAVSGTPTTAGDFSFSVLVADSGRQATSAQDSIDVVPALALKTSQSGTIYVESGCDTVCGGFATQSGGLAPYKYDLKSGSLPAGTSLSGTSLAGKFTTLGAYSFTVQATDALGATEIVATTFSVLPHIYFFCPSNYMPAANAAVPWIACYSKGSGAYNGGMTFDCAQGPHVACMGLMSFAGGGGNSWTVTYHSVVGDAAAGEFIPESVTAPAYGTYTGNVVMVQLAGVSTPVGACAGGTLLVTISDHFACGAGGQSCSTSAYLRWSACRNR